MSSKSKSGSAKSSKKGSAGKSAGSAANDDATKNDQKSVQELTVQMAELTKRLEDEKAERNYFQLERDKISTFWDITRNELDNLRAELRNKDRELEELEERHQVEIKVYKQKVKHLLYEYQNNVTHLQSESEQALQLDHQDSLTRENELKKDKKALKLELKELELSHEDIIRNLKDSHDQEITKLRQDYERRAEEMHSKYDKQLKSLREELELRRKNEIHEIEERKNGQIAALMRNHEKAFADIKNYYNDITLNNLALINSLKEQVEEMKKREERSEKLMAEITAENKRLSEPLQKALEEGDSLRKKLGQYEKDKNSLALCKARLKNLESSTKQLSWEHEVLQQRYTLTASERDELRQKFTAVVHDAQQKAGVKSIILERKLEALADQLEKKEIQLSEVLRASNLDPSAIVSVNRKLEDILDDKNNVIKQLQHDLSRLSKAYNEMLLVVEAKFTEYSIPMDEVGIKTLVPKSIVKILTTDWSGKGNGNQLADATSMKKDKMAPNAANNNNAAALTAGQ